MIRPQRVNRDDDYVERVEQGGGLLMRPLAGRRGAKRQQAQPQRLSTIWPMRNHRFRIHSILLNPHNGRKAEKRNGDRRMRIPVAPKAP
jgi:hypothetical protein